MVDDTFFQYSINILTALLLIVTGFYAWQTKKTVEEMENARKSQYTPSLKIETTHFIIGGDLSVKITNIGIGTAKNIKGKLKLEPDGEEIDIIYPLLYPRDSFALMQPFMSVKYVANAKNYKLKLSASCEDILGTIHEVKDSFNLKDIENIKNDYQSRNKIVKELRDTNKELKNLAGVIKAKKI